MHTHTPSIGLNEDGIKYVRYILRKVWGSVPRDSTLVV